MTASTVGGDGNLWYVGNLANTVGKITPAGRVTEYALAAGSSPYAITWGPDGNVWFVDEGSAKVGRITPSGTITTYSTPTASSRPAGITVGPDGNLWFTEYGVSNVGKITTAGTITEYPIGSTSNPVGIATGADGNLWFAEESGNHVGRMTTSGTVTQYAVTASSTPYAITAGPDGNLWFTEADGNNIGKVTTGGTVTEYAIPTTNTDPNAIVAGPDGNLWFTEGHNTTVGNVTPSGSITEISPGISSTPAGIALGADGNIWFTEWTANKIGRYAVPNIGGALTPAQAPTGKPFCLACAAAAAVGTTTHSPVNTESGNFFHAFSDISIPGRSYSLALARTYNSQNASTNSPFGYGWQFNAAMALTVTGTSPNRVATITQEDSSQATFNEPATGNTWAPSAPRFIATLTYNSGSSTWTLVRQGRDTYTFNSSGQLTIAADLNGYTTSYAYTSGNLTTITDPAGRTITLGWTGGHITSLTDANISPSRSVDYSYDGSGNLQDVTDVAGGDTHFGYDGSHRVTTMKDPVCQAIGAGCPGVQNHYDGSGRVDWQKDQLNRQTAFAYAGDPATADGGTTTVTDPAGNATVDTYEYGLRVQTTRGYGTAIAVTTKLTYDPRTLVPTAVVDPRGNATSLGYDSHGNLLTTTDPLGNMTTSTYNSLNEPLTSKDGNGVTTTYTYDARGNRLSQSRPLVGPGQTQLTTNRYQDPSHPGDVTSMVDPDGKVWNYVYDQYGDRTQTIDPLGNQSTAVYNSIGWMTSSYTPKGAAVPTAVASGGLATTKGWSMAQRSDGSVWGWGYNVDSESGNGNVTSPVLAPSEVCAAGQVSPCSQFLSGVTSIAAGGQHGIAAKSDGTAWDWGKNTVGQLGTGNLTNSKVPIQPNGLTGIPVTSVAAGNEHSLALTGAGNVYSWGVNTHGELGDGTLVNRHAPVEVCAPGQSSPCTQFLSNVTAVASHRSFSVAVRSDGSVVAWGLNDHGQLGDGTTTTRSIPVQVCAVGQVSPCSQFLGGIVAVATGDSFSVALKSDGTVYAWGANDDGQLASGTYDTSSHTIPAAVPGLPSITQVAAGKQHVLAIAADGTVRSWGANSAAELGINTVDSTGCACRTTVQTVPGLFQAVSVAAGQESSLAVTVDGRSWSWGGNSQGELGNGSSGTNVLVPTSFSGVLGVPSATYQTQYGHDNFGNVTTVTDPLGHVTQRHYDADQNVDWAQDGNQSGSTKTQYTYDLANQKTVVTRADGTTLTTDYNLDGTVLDQKDGKSNAIQTYGYDALARVITATDALGNVTTYSYDGAGNRLTQQDPGGNCSAVPATGCTTTTYDAANQRTATSYSDGVTPNVTNLTYDGDGQRTGMTDGTGASSWVWDSLHRLSSYTNGNGAQVQYAYNLRDLPTTITYPGSNNVTRGYDAAGRWTSVQDWLGNTTSFGYDPNSNLTTQALPTGTAMADSSTYDAADRLMATADVRGGSTTLFSASYTRDNANQLVSDNSATASQGSYRYTPLNQVCYAGSANTSACASPPSGAQPLGYDAADNLTQMGSTQQAFNAADELCWTAATTSSCATPPTGATTYSYDTRGNRAQVVPPAGGSTTLAYDQANRLTSHTAAATTTYGYNGDGLRMSKSAGTTTQYLWDGASLIKDGSTAYVYGPGGVPLEQVSGTTVLWLHHDQLGSTRLITDSTGTTQATYTFDPYGNLAASTGTVTNPFRFTGQYQDPESGLYYLRARYYDPATAQFISRDPAVALTRSPYAYVAGNPLNAIDPTGLAWDAPGGFCIKLPFQDNSHCGTVLSPVQGAVGVGVAAGAAACIAGGCEAAAAAIAATRVGQACIAAAGAVAGFFSRHPEDDATVATGAEDVLMPGGQAIGQAGAPEVRVVQGGPQAIQSLWQRLTAGATAGGPTGYPGSGMNLPGGGWAGLRNSSGYGPTIDVNVPGVPYDKIHFAP